MRSMRAWLILADGGVSFQSLGNPPVSRPLCSLVVTFRFLEERTACREMTVWSTRPRDAYLEAWGHGPNAPRVHSPPLNPI